MQILFISRYHKWFHPMWHPTWIKPGNPPPLGHDPTCQRRRGEGGGSAMGGSRPTPCAVSRTSRPVRHTSGLALSSPTTSLPPLSLPLLPLSLRRSRARRHHSHQAPQCFNSITGEAMQNPFVSHCVPLLICSFPSVNCTLHVAAEPSQHLHGFNI